MSSFYYLTIKERKVIEEFSKKGFSFHAIAKEVKRGTSTIRREIKKNGGKENYNAEEAQKYFSSYLDKKVLYGQEGKMSEYIQDIEKRLDAFEMQLEIIFEMLKEIKG